MINRLLHAILVALILAAAIIPTVGARDRDPLAPVHGMEAHQFEAFPPGLISQPNVEAIVALVNEVREFGVPVAVRVVSLPTDHEALSAFDDLDLTQPIPQETVHEMARAWMATEPIESSPGAEDGFLMLVVMPDDRTLSSAVIEPGPNALPLNGITQANIDQVIQDLVLPRFANNEISQGIRNGLSVFSYNNLFGEPERIELDPLHQDLRFVASVPLAGITAISAVGLVALAMWIGRRRVESPTPPDDERLTPFAAAALHEGRVSNAVVTGGLLDLVRAGVLVPHKGPSPELRLDLRRAEKVDDPFLAAIVATLRVNADERGVVSGAGTHRLHDLMVPPQRILEDQLASHGLLNRDGRIETMWLLLASALVAAIALFTLLPSLLGMARFGIVAILFAGACITGTLLWASRRSWTTERGREALNRWVQTAPLNDQAVFDTVVGQDALISAQGGPIIPETVTMVRALRGLGQA